VVALRRRRAHLRRRRARPALRRLRLAAAAGVGRQRASMGSSRPASVVARLSHGLASFLPLSGGL
jgi:hypothetical protein